MTEQLSVADVLERAADLIEPEGAWTQGVAALSSGGWKVDPLDPRAACFCMLGSVSHAGRCDFGSAPFQDAVDILRTVLGTSVVKFNDAPGRTQAEVVAKLREAAARARATTPA